MNEEDEERIGEEILEIVKDGCSLLDVATIPYPENVKARMLIRLASQGKLEIVTTNGRIRVKEVKQ